MTIYTIINTNTNEIVLKTLFATVALKTFYALKQNEVGVYRLTEKALTLQSAFQKNKEKHKKGIDKLKRV